MIRSHVAPELHGADPRSLTWRQALILALLAFALAAPATAELGTVDAVPSATLLIPRFDVDLADEQGLTTLISVNNASSAPALAHVTVWSEWSVPILDFDIYLTGYDVQTLNLGDLLRNGVLPRTGPSDALPSDDGDVSNTGLYSQTHDTFGGTCSTTPGIQPNYEPISGTFLAIVQQGLSGQPLSTNGLCSSEPGQESIARGYITIDSVSSCSQEFPSNTGYFVDGGLGVANNENVLWGDFFICNPREALARGFTAVHIEADATVLPGGTACDVVDFAPTTFYCPLIEATYAPAPPAGADNREGLGSVYATRYVMGGGFDGGTELLVYRDSNRGPGSPRDCATTPTRMTQNQIVVFDEEENPIVALVGGPSGGPAAGIENPFPWCSNLARVGVDLTVDRDFGWLYLNLNGGLDPSEHNQAYVLTTMDADGRYGVGYDAQQLNNLTFGAAGASNPTLP